MSTFSGKYLSPAEVATRLSTSRNTVHRAIARGDLQAVKYGRLVRIPEEAFTAFLRQHQATPVTPGRRTA